MKRRIVNAEIKIRIRVMQEFGVDMPETARVLFDWALGGNRQFPTLSFAVAALPPTVNHMYETKARGQRVLSAETLRFRDLTAIAVGGKRHTWKPRGAIMAMVFLQSPHWITQKHTMRDMDGDNRLKPLFDAIECCTGQRDNANWQHHCYKLASNIERTTVYLFDLGDLIEYYGKP